MWAWFDRLLRAGLCLFVTGLYFRGVLDQISSHTDVPTPFHFVVDLDGSVSRPKKRARRDYVMLIFNKVPMGESYSL